MRFRERCGRAGGWARGGRGWALRAVWAALAVAAAGACTFAPGGLETALCSNGVAVAEPAENAGLVADCAALLGLKQELAGDAVLNWSEELPLEEWEGVSTGGEEDAPARVTELQLDGRGLTGEIPARLGALSMLEGLWLHDNRSDGRRSRRRWGRWSSWSGCGSTTTG